MSASLLRRTASDGKPLAARAVEAGRLSLSKTARSEDGGGLVGTAGLVALPRTLILSCAVAATTLTAATAPEPRIEAPVFLPPLGRTSASYGRPVRSA